MVWLLVAVGLLILIVAGDMLVHGAVNLSFRLGIPAFLVSLTVVAFGTSAPELVVAINAALDDVPGIAVGNVVGSNIANILLVLGIPAMISVLHTSDVSCKRDYLFMIFASIFFIILAHLRVLTVLHGLVMLAILFAYLFTTALHSKRSKSQKDAEEDLEGLDNSQPMWRILGALILGGIGLPLGAELLVDNATIIAKEYGISDAIIGLTLVAIGTSLPELATTVMAALRRQADVAIGNVIGSNIFNILAILGVASFFSNIPIEESFLKTDLWVMLFASLALGPFVFFGWNISRLWGALLTMSYMGYVVLILS